LPAANQALGPVTLLVNNASTFLQDRFGALDAAVWQTQFDINLRAPVFLAEAFAAQLPEESEGNIINMIDQRVLRPNPAMTSYMLSKSALWMATQTMAQAFAPRVRVNGIGPGPTLPSLHDADGRHFENEVANLPLGHAVDLADFGRAVRFLVEARSVTGQLLALDCGQHLAWPKPEESDDG
jgi:NAD(P)-dependent dehydrogenase (short-subunit alcohol dehydrogenase family)